MKEGNGEWGGGERGSGGARERESGRAGDKEMRRDIFSPTPSLPRSLAPPLPRSPTLPLPRSPTPHSPLLSLSEFCLRLFLDPHGLDVDEFADAFARKLAPVARTLHSAEGQSRVGRDHGVDEDQARVYLIDQAAALLVIISPGAGGQAEGRVVGEADRFVEVAYAEERGDRAEHLFEIGRRIRGNICENRRREVVARAHQPLVSGEDAAALRHSLLHLFFERFENIKRCERADVSRIVHRVADL